MPNSRMYERPWYVKHSMDNNPLYGGFQPAPFSGISSSPLEHKVNGADISDMGGIFKGEGGWSKLYTILIGGGLAAFAVAGVLGYNVLASPNSSGNLPPEKNPVQSSKVKGNLGLRVYETPIPIPTVTPTPTPIRPTPTPDHMQFSIEKLAEVYRNALQLNYDAIKDPEQKGRDEATYLRNQIIKAFFYGADDKEDLIERLVVMNKIANQFFAVLLDVQPSDEDILEASTMEANTWMDPAYNKWDRESMILGYFGGHERSLAAKLNKEK